MRTRGERWRLHGALVLGLAVCAVGFTVELGRGLDGHLPAWVYVVEWPLFAAGGVFLWWRLLHDDPDADDRPAAAPVPDDTELTDDADLVAWREYVGRLEAAEGPGTGNRSGPDGT